MQVFGQIDWNKSGEVFPPENPCFRLLYTSEKRVSVKNITTNGFVEVDCYRLDPNEEWELEDNNIVSIYGWKRTSGEVADCAGDEIEYLYGLDPKSLRLVRHDPDRHGASVQAEDVVKTFKRADGSLAGISHVSFTIAPSTLVGVYGESGIGKSVLINSLVAPDGGQLESGRVLVDGLPATGGAGIAYLPQRMSFPDVLKTKEIVRQGQSRTCCSEERKKRILELCHVKIEGPGGWGNLRFRALSGGQQRRLALAMALLDERVRLVVADEPTTGFDIGTEREVMRGLRRLVRLENITVIVVTHSVFALPIFDKVLVLSKCKFGEESGARLCFDSQWLPEYFPEELRQKPQDADRLTALYEGRVSGRVVKNKFQSPYCHQMRMARHGMVRKLHSFGRQCLSWAVNCSKMAIRQRTFRRFVGLSVLCVLMIQLGTCCNNRSNEVFLSFMVLCAPWLCATYTAMFGSELLGWFSWEKLSGGSSRGFCVGVLAGLLLPYMCISLIFTMGLFFPPNMERIVDEAYVVLSRINAGACISHFINDKEKSDYSNEISSMAWKGTQRVWKDPPQLMVGCAELGCDKSQGAPYSRDYASVNRDQDAAHASSRSRTPWRLIGVQWGLLTLICLVGGTMGLAAIAWFRDAKSAVLLIVILYIGFIMLSRVCVEPHESMYALNVSSGAVLGKTDVRWIPLICLSYLGISRYAYNVLVYQLNGAYLYDWLPLLGWATVCLGIALRRLANPMQNWRAFER